MEGGRGRRGEGGARRRLGGRLVPPPTPGRPRAGTHPLAVLGQAGLHDPVPDAEHALRPLRVPGAGGPQPTGGGSWRTEGAIQSPNTTTTPHNLSKQGGGRVIGQRPGDAPPPPSPFPRGGGGGRGQGARAWGPSVWRIMKGSKARRVRLRGSRSTWGRTSASSGFRADRTWGGGRGDFLCPPKTE